MDPLSDVLALLKPRSYVSGGWGTSGDMAVRFPRHDGIKCYVIVSGQCWLSLEGVPEPVRLTAGDCVLLPSGRPFILASDLSLAPVDYRVFLSAAKDGCGAGNGAETCFITGGHFSFAPNHASILLGVLPPIVHIREESERSALRWCIERMARELREPQPGGSLIAEHLVHMILLQALRLHLAEGARRGIGWLFALADKQMSAAINAIHEDTAHDWTLQELARRAGMSRSTFALKFKQTVGSSPMEYLARWRMLLAGDRLTNSSDSVSAISLSLGYESESAFSTAFKRVMGCSPRQYSRDRKEHYPSHDEAAARDRGLEPIAS